MVRGMPLETPEEASWRWRWLSWVPGPGEWLALQDGGLLVMNEELEGHPVRFKPGARWPEPMEALEPLRTASACVLLDDGRVLATGGMDGDGRDLDSSALLHPHSRRWTPGPSLLKARSSHAMHKLRDGQVLVVGGFDEGRALSEVERVAPTAGHIEPTGSLLAPLGTTWLWETQDGSILALPRDRATSKPPQRYVTASKEWVWCAPPPRDFVVWGLPCGLPRGFLIVVQGKESGVWRYDATTDDWSEVPLPRHWRVGSTLPLRDGWVLFVTRDFLDAWLCHPETGTWRPAPAWHRPRNARLIALTDGTLFAAAPGADGCDARAEQLAPSPGHAESPLAEEVGEDSRRRFAEEVSPPAPPSQAWGEEDSFRVARLRDAIRARPQGDAWTRTEAEHILERIAEQWELGARLQRTRGELQVSRPVVPMEGWGGVDAVELLPVLLHASSMQAVTRLTTEPTWPRLPEHHPLRAMDDELRGAYVQGPGSATRTDARERMDWALKGMSSAGVMASLRSLRVGPRRFPAELRHDGPRDSRLSRGVLWLGEARYVPSMAPALKHLRMVANGILAGEWMLPELESLVLLSGGLSGRTVRGLARSSLPRMKKLWLGLGCAARAHPDDEPIASVDEVLSLLNSEVLTQVNELGLVNTPDSDLWVLELERRAVLRRLTRLDLSWGRLSGPGVEALLRASMSVPRLSRLDLTGTALSADAREALQSSWGARLRIHR